MTPQKTNSYFNKILYEKRRLGSIEWQFLGSRDISRAHLLLGAEVKLQVKKVLDRKISQLSSEELVEAFDNASSCHDILQEKIVFNKSSQLLSCLLSHYVECLTMWARGAGLADYVNPKIFEINRGKMYPPLILGLLLQSEPIRCQTGIYRDSKDSITFWHTEEDEEQYPRMHFDKLRIFSFINNIVGPETTVYSFIYPHLLPGPAFGWNTSGYIQAVDSLYLKPNIQREGLFSNIITWMTLFSGGRIPLLEIVAELGPYLDGNVITCIYRTKIGAESERIEFAGSKHKFSKLGKEVGSHLYQANIFSDRNSDIAARYETDDRQVLGFMEKRIRRTNRFFCLDSKRISPEKVHKLLTSHYLDDSGYANTYVKAYLMGLTTSIRTSLWVGNGSAISGDCPIHIDFTTSGA